MSKTILDRFKDTRYGNHPPAPVGTKSTYAREIKHYPPAIQEWSGSIYAYNDNATKLSPYSDNLVSSIVKIYFNSYSRMLEGNVIKKRSRRYRLLRARLSTNRTFVSNAEVKHTNDKVFINVYIYNRVPTYYKRKLDRIALNENIYKLITQAKARLISKLKDNRLLMYNIADPPRGYNQTAFISLRMLRMYKAYERGYIQDFFTKFLRVHLRREIVYFYYKQLIGFNKLKFGQGYVSSLSDEIRKVYNKNVEFNFVNLKYLYLNSSIFSSALVTKIRNRKNKPLKVISSFLGTFKVPEIEIRKVYKQMFHKAFIVQKLDLDAAEEINAYKAGVTQGDSHGEYNNNAETSYDYDAIDSSLHNIIPGYAPAPPYKRKPLNELTKVLGSMRNKTVSGARIEIAGRLTRRNTAARAVSKLKYKGNIKDMDSSNKGLSTVMLRGNLKSNIQHTKVVSKWRIGSFGFKGWVSSV